MTSRPRPGVAPEVSGPTRASGVRRAYRSGPAVNSLTALQPSRARFASVLRARRWADLGESSLRRSRTLGLGSREPLKLPRAASSADRRLLGYFLDLDAASTWLGGDHVGD